MGSSALPNPITQLHRQYALTARTGDEIRLPLYLMAAGGLAEVLFEIKRPGLAGIKAFAFDCQVVLGNFRVHQDIGQLGGKPRLSEPVGYGFNAFPLEEGVERIDHCPLKVTHQ